MEEDADLALLDQHLLKTNLLSQRMTSILGQLDTRLSRLDKTIAPLGLQPLARKAANIDLALASLGLPISTSSSSLSQPQTQARQTSNPTRPPRTVAPPPAAISRLKTSGYSLEPPVSLAPIPGTPIHSLPPSATATPADETAILTRGPDIMALGEYFSALDSVVADLERMWRGLIEGRGGAREAGVKDLSTLVDVGLGGLVQLFLQIVRDGASRLLDPDNLIASGPPTPQNLFPSLQTLTPISTHLLQYIDPQSPHQKTRELAHPQLDQLTRGLADLRGSWQRRTLAPIVERVEEVDEGGIWEGGRGREKVKAIVVCWEVLLVLVEAETLLITSLFPNTPPAELLSLTLASPLALVNNTIVPTIATIKRSPASHSFVALDLYQSLVRLQPRWEQSVTKCLAMLDAQSSSTSTSLISALSGHIATLRQLSIRSFPELLVDIRSAAMQNTAPSSAISDTTYSTLTYLETLPAYESTVQGLLGSSQSQRSWLMGQKEAPSPVRSAEEEGGLVNLFVADVLGTLIIHLNQKSGSMRRPIAQTCLLNNPSFDSDIIGPGAENMLNKAYREAKSQFLSEFTSMTQILTSAPQTTRFVPNITASTERQHLKDASTQFFDKLAELESVCLQYPLSRGDPDLRDRIGKEAGELVGGAWRTFLGRCSGKGVDKYLRGSPEEISKRVQAIFR